MVSWGCFYSQYSISDERDLLLLLFCWRRRVVMQEVWCPGTRVRTIPSSAPNTNTDTGSDVIRSNKNYISTTDEYKVAFSLRPSTAVAHPQSNVCKRARRSKNLALKACYVRPSTAVTYTDVTRDDRNVRVTTITHALRALSNSRLATVHLWLAIAKAVRCCPARLKLFDAAKVRGPHTHLGGIKQLQSFDLGRDWRDITHDKLAVGIGFYMRTLPAPPPWCLCSVSPVFPTMCNEAVWLTGVAL